MSPATSASNFSVGEPRTRRWPLALALGLAAPGLGYLYVGRWITGALVAVLMHVVMLGTYAFYIVGGRDLNEMVRTAFLVTGVVWALQALPPVWLAWQQSQTYRLTKANRLGAYFAFVGATIALRIVNRALAGTLLFAVLAANDPGMTPTIEQGARVAVVRWAFDPTRLEAGDVVAYDAAAPGEPSTPAFGRVIATPRQSVVFHGDFAIIDGTPTAHRPCSVEEQVVFAEQDARTRCRVETIRGKNRVVAATHVEGPPTAELVVPDSAVLLLGDDRDRAKDGRTLGPVPHDKLFGRAAAIVGGAGRQGRIR